jgi:hypothetical protein
MFIGFFAQRLVDHINRILASTESARFAVDYFFMSGLTSIAERLAGMKELRLLIGNTTNRETLEQLAEGYRCLEMVAEEIERQNYPKRTDAKKMADTTAENLRSSVELMDQTDEADKLESKVGSALLAPAPSPDLRDTPEGNRSGGRSDRDRNLRGDIEAWRKTEREG